MLYTKELIDLMAQFETNSCENISFKFVLLYIMVSFDEKLNNVQKLLLILYQ
jgi:hypothetical protein